MKTEATAAPALKGVRELFSITWQEYKRRASTLLLIALLPTAWSIITSLSPLSSESASYAAIAIAICIYVITIFVSSLSAIALLLAVHNKQLTAGEAYEQSFGKLFSYWWILALSGGITLLGSILIIPGIIFWVWFIFAPYVFIAEGIKGSQALSRSKQYVKGRWWQVFWRLIFITLAGVAAYFIVGLPFIIYFFVQMGTAMHFSKISSDIADPIASFFMLPFQTLFLYNLYKNIKGELSVTEVKRSNALVFWGIFSISLISIIPTLFLVVYMFLFRPFQVIGEAMYPTYQNKEYMITSVLDAKIANFKRGDVIVFTSPVDPEKDFIKRIIGVPGDRIMLRDGMVYLNGQLFDESAYLKPDVKTYGGNFLHEGEEMIVPDNSFFVLGDNRPFSSDSREWGFLPDKSIISKVLFCYANCPKQ